MNNNPDKPSEWPIHSLTKEREDMQRDSANQALIWQQQEAMAYAQALLYLQQACRGETPHD